MTKHVAALACTALATATLLTGCGSSSSSSSTASSTSTSVASPSAVASASGAPASSSPATSASPAAGAASSSATPVEGQGTSPAASASSTPVGTGSPEAVAKVTKLLQAAGCSSDRITFEKVDAKTRANGFTAGATCKATGHDAMAVATASPAVLDKLVASMAQRTGTKGQKYVKGDDWLMLVADSSGTKAASADEIAKVAKAAGGTVATF